MDKTNLFSIGEVSKMFHISVSSLRHYENIGLLTPKYISKESGYRYYSLEQFEILNTIRYLRALDMSLLEIESFLKNKDLETINKMLLEQKEAVQEKQRVLKRIEQKINNRLDWLKDATNIPLNTISIIKLPSCRIVWVDECLDIKNSIDLERPIRKLDQSDAEAVIFLGKVGLGISCEHLLKEEIKKYDGIFLILDNEDLFTGKTSLLKETLCVRLRFRGSHLEAQKEYKKLLNYIKENKMQISGFSREITLIDYGVTNDIDKFVTEICIPVNTNNEEL